MLSQPFPSNGKNPQHFWELQKVSCVIRLQKVSHCDRFQPVNPDMHSTFVVTILYHGEESFIFCHKILYLFYGPVSLSHFRHFSMFTAASPIWKLPNMLPIFLLLPVPFFLSPVHILSRMLPTLYFTILSPIPKPWAYSFKFLCLRSRFARN